MAEPVKKDDALAAAVREAFQRHMENARLAALSSRSPSYDARQGDARPFQDRRPLPDPVPSSQVPEDVASEALEEAAATADTMVSERPAPVGPEPAIQGPPPQDEEDDDRSEPRLPTAGTSRADMRLSAPVLPSRQPPAPEPAGNPGLGAGRAGRRTVPSSAPPSQAVALTSDRAPLRSGELVTTTRRPTSRQAGDLPPSSQEKRPSQDGRHAFEPLARGEHTIRRVDEIGARGTEAPPPARDRQLSPPSPANDREIRLTAARAREREQLAALAARNERMMTRRRPEPISSTRALEPPRDLDLDARPAQAPQAPSSDGAARSKRAPAQPREVANVNVSREARFGSGGRNEARARANIRWAIFAAVLLVSAGCIGFGAYLWMRAAPGVSQPPASGKSDAAPAAVTPGPSSMAPADLPASARSVRTTAIRLDAIDLALQDARERIASGDIPAARAILERFREGGDARTLVGLAETYDPSIVPDATYADSRQAQALYEAAGKAGFAGTADRLAKLQLDPPQ
jgi:hypothetical protein